MNLNHIYSNLERPSSALHAQLSYRESYDTPRPLVSSYEFSIEARGSRAWSAETADSSVHGPARCEHTLSSREKGMNLIHSN